MADITETPQTPESSQAPIAIDMAQAPLNKALIHAQSANAHLAIAASLDNKATIMSIIGAILTIAVALGFHVNATVILSAAGLIVSGIFAIVHAAHAHTLLAIQLLKGE